MRTLLLIDTHALLHRFFHALPPLTTPDGAPIQAIYGLSQVLLKFLSPREGACPEYFAAALDRPEPTFRAKQFAAYKIHRPPTPETLISQIKRLPAMFEAFRVRTLSVPGFEADDILGTLAERFKREPDLTTVIVSGDLDVLQLVENGRVLVDLIKRGTNEMERYDETAVMARFGIAPPQLTDYKGLVGDTSDNIPGVRGIGKIAAQELLKEFVNIERIYEDIGLVKRTYAEKLTADREVAFESKELATIRRDAPLSLSSLEELRTAPPNTPALMQFFTQMGFESLARRL